MNSQQRGGVFFYGAERRANRPPQREARREPKSTAFERSVLSAGLGFVT